jgi:hypothetical protein
MLLMEHFIRKKPLMKLRNFETLKLSGKHTNEKAADLHRPAAVN